MELVIKSAALALVALVLAVFLHRYSPQMALLTALSALVSAARNLAAQAGLSRGELLPLGKVMGVAICTRLTSELCRDNGNRALAAQVELCGAVCGLLCALPLVEQALGLLGAI
mgnify:CR=1 FL=1